MVLHASSAAIPPGETRQLIFDSIKSNGDKVFMIDGLSGVQLTYQELYEKAVSVAICLNKSGVGDGSSVGVLIDASLVCNIFFTGVVLSGAALCPMNPTLEAEEIRQLLDICKAKFIFCEEKYLSLLEAALVGYPVETTIVTDVKHGTYNEIKNMMDEDPEQFQMGSYDPEESVVYVLFTSGTTGQPKGVVTNSRAANVVASRLRMKDLLFMCTSPLYWMSYIAFAVCTLVHGTTLIVPRTKYIPGTNNVDLSHILDCVQKYKPHSWFTGPTVLMELCTLPSTSSFDLSSLKSVTVGGAHILPSQRRQICDKVFSGRNIVLNGYGATEVGAITYWPDGAPDHDSHLAGSLGKLMSGFTLKVEDVDTGAELGPGQTGEFVVKSTAIMTGYMNQPEKYTPDDWYRMGDLGYYDDEGYIYFSSRLKEIMKYRGLHIAPVELEKVVIQHPQVQEVCVVGRPHSIDGERPAAFVVRKSSSLTEKELLNFVEERVVASKKLRGGVFFVESIPKNGIGKVLRRNLVKLFEGMGDD